MFTKDVYCPRETPLFLVCACTASRINPKMPWGVQRGDQSVCRDHLYLTWAPFEKSKETFARSHKKSSHPLSSWKPPRLGKETYLSSVFPKRLPELAFTGGGGRAGGGRKYPMLLGSE